MSSAPQPAAFSPASLSYRRMFSESRDHIYVTYFQLRLLKVKFKGQHPKVKQNLGLHLLCCLYDLRQSMARL